jgi:hypothetical protein
MPLFFYDNLSTLTVHDMAKNDVQRVTDTLAFLQNTALVTPAERTPAWQLATNYVNAVHNNQLAPAYHVFSQSLALGVHVINDTNQCRHMARALFLLWKAMHHYDSKFVVPLINASQINQATVDVMLTSYIRKARCLHDRLNGNNAGAAHVLAQFALNPLAFLSHNKVFIAGASFLDAGQAPQNILACKFEYSPHHDRYVFGVRQAVPAGGIGIQVDSVTAFHWTDQRYVRRPLIPTHPPPVIGATNFQNMSGIELSGLHPMVTTQFTGCAFCMAEDAGSMYCAHVSPAGVPKMAPNTDGPTLARRITATNGVFANANNAAVRVFGRNAGSGPNAAGYNLGIGGGATDYMTIVGFPGGTSYQIFSQTTRAARIAAVRRIF